ncbi:sirohydrochlorin chelatase [Metabacillus sp. RGM 3146]|uniref:sirohydrochlorin chelatase n=1 Tax=Metabacillus sp. RGM 3146 TaxID=3401092 RepID=UPI003B9B9FB1
MPQAILYICHGSRVKKARDEAVDFIQECQKTISVPIQEISFLELAEPSIAEGFETCIQKGATQIAVVPLLLLTAVHAKKDIPREIAKLHKKYPDISITYGKPIGVQESMADAVYEQMNDAMTDKQDTRVLLIGRGSSDPDVKRDMMILAELLKERYELSAVDVCFLTAAEPSFETKLAEMNHVSESNILVVPYLLFTGLLMKGIEKEIKQMKTDKNIMLCSYIGYSHHVRQAFSKRVHEALNGEYGFFTFEEAGQ